MKPPRRGYERAVVTVPVTVPYVRHSIHGAHWFVARALRGVLEASGLGKSDIDGLCLSSFTLGPDSAVGLTQHLGLTLRWLDHIPMGGAGAMVALRRALRAVESGDATVVACVGADANQVDSFRATLGSFSQFSQAGPSRCSRRASKLRHRGKPANWEDSYTTLVRSIRPT